MPVYNTDPRWLRAAIGSVQTQLYSNWELCISDDASTLERVRDLLLDFARRYPRIRVFLREHNGNISANSNDALASGRHRDGVWLDRIRAGAFEDTNRIFVPPEA